MTAARDTTLDALLADPALLPAMVEGTRTRTRLAGIDASDYDRVTSGLTSAHDWPTAFVAAAGEHRALGEAAERAGRRRTAAEAMRTASLWYHFATCIPHPDRAMHRLGARSARECLVQALVLEDRPGESTRVDGPYASHGLLRRPADVDRPGLVVVVPGMDSSTAEFALVADALEARGLATLCLDGPGQGVLSDIIAARHDYEHVVSKALDAVRDRRDLDLARVGVAGLSLGGFYAARVGAYEQSVQAVATVTGPYRFGPWQQMWPVVQHTLLQRLLSQDAAMLFSEQLDLAGVAELISPPLLVVAGGQDGLCTADEARRLVDESKQGELLLVQDGDHLCANRPWLWRPQLADWFAHQLSR